MALVVFPLMLGDHMNVYPPEPPDTLTTAHASEAFGHTSSPWTRRAFNCSAKGRMELMLYYLNSVDKGKKSKVPGC